MTVAIWCRVCMPMAGFSRPSTPTTAPGSARGSRSRWPRACASSQPPNKAVASGSAGTQGSGASALTVSEDTGQSVEDRGQVAAEVAQVAEVAGERTQVTLEVPKREAVFRVGDRRQVRVEA